ncbi:MAG: hypothetical protein ABWW65_04095 [Thermoprotei archaeon]
MTKRIFRSKILTDTKPLYRLITTWLGLTSDHGYAKYLLEYLNKLGISLASVWPVFTEALYFFYRDHRGRRDFNEKLADLKRILVGVEEISVEFHEVVKHITRDFGLADTALLEAAKRDPLLTILSEDSRLVNRARSMGIRAFTPCELLSIGLE